jgi:16S rRNA A1518/A1519 N6-dimethyltransferase RsmA/KsgA/DIM1 with predicted DNA glycosylase/AP lyase activity
MHYRPSKSTILACILCFISRKQVALAIGSCLSSLKLIKNKETTAKALETLHLSPSARGEELDLNQYAALVEELKK